MTKHTDDWRAKVIILVLLMILAPGRDSRGDAFNIEKIVGTSSMRLFFVRARVGALGFGFGVFGLILIISNKLKKSRKSPSATGDVSSPESASLAESEPPDSESSSSSSSSDDLSQSSELSADSVFTTFCFWWITNL